MVKSNYTPNLVTHRFYSDIGIYVIGTPQLLTSKTSTAGVAGAGNVLFDSVPSDETVKYIVIYKETGNPSENPLIGIIESGVGLPFDTNGGDVSITWSSGPSKIFKL